MQSYSGLPANEVLDVTAQKSLWTGKQWCVGGRVCQTRLMAVYVRVDPVTAVAVRTKRQIALQAQTAYTGAALSSVQANITAKTDQVRHTQDAVIYSEQANDLLQPVAPPS